MKSVCMSLRRGLYSLEIRPFSLGRNLSEKPPPFCHRYWDFLNHPQDWEFACSVHPEFLVSTAVGAGTDQRNCEKDGGI